jgi:hypothetical protein
MIFSHRITLVVDNALAVVERYHDKIVKFESQILLKPKMTICQHCAPSLLLFRHCLC